MSSGEIIKGQSVPLPFRAESIRFEATWSHRAEEPVDLGLDCCLLGKTGAVQGFVDNGHTAAAAGAVTFQSSVDGKTESVSVVPNKLKGNCEALLLIVSALDGDTGRTDLSSAAGLTFKLASLDDEDRATSIAGGSLQQFLADSRQEGGADPDEQIMLLRRNEDRELTALNRGSEVKKVRLDFGWVMQPPKPAGEDGEGEAAEVAEPEWRCSMLDAQGEEVQSVSSKGKEAEGVSGLPEPEEAAAEAAEDGEVPPAAPTPAAPKDPFPLKDSIIIDLQALPQAVRHIAVMVSSTGEGGLQAVQSSHVRLQDASSATPAQQQSLGWLCISGMPAPKSPSILLCKLHKDSTCSALAVWRATQTSSVPAMVQGEATALEATLRQLRLDQTKQAASTKQLAALTESGEDIPQEARDAVAAGFRWRIRCIGSGMGSNPAEELQDELKRTVGYYGRTDADGKREDSRAYALYPNATRILGHTPLIGQGMMLMPDGALYTGAFQADKFDGTGTHSYPAGSTYTGSWKAGKKHGQGVLLDTAGGRLDGTWDAGIQAGPAVYTQRGFRFSGGFQQGLPSGPCSFALAAPASQGLPPPAAAHLRCLGTPTLRSCGAYNFVPAGATGGEGEEDGESAGPKLPSFPDYDGLLYKAGAALPRGMEEISYGPEASTNNQPVEQYRNPWGLVRVGKLLEDLDSLAGNIAFRHCEPSDASARMPLLVTASVDSIALSKRLSLDQDVTLSGQVVWTGRSALDIRMQLSQGSAELQHASLVALFTFVARDPATLKSMEINSLIPSTDAEKSWFEEREALAQSRRAAREASKQSSGLAVSAEMADMLQEAKNLVDLPALGKGDSMLIQDTSRENLFVCQPQHQNMHGRIFGGFLMRRAFELAYATAFMFAGARPNFDRVGEITFLRPVDVGDLLRLTSKVMHTANGHSKNVLLLEVEASVTRPEEVTSNQTNKFLFCFHTRPDKPLKRVLPSTLEEAAHVDALETAGLE
ncbi:hypothetical protein WJX84_005719 [Apatococcus fuscideae]|uniref:HotDog ACOT-type domain-containing protein n=1 Tax=Apatococcus fuscideae TaxID=2026836 RepID=A0AAW1SWC6_9CHLO